MSTLTTDHGQAGAPSSDQPGAGGPPRAHPGIGRHWTADEYQPRICGSGAEKLAASAVAPLVGVARGGESLFHVSPKDTTAKCHRLGIDKRRGQGRRFADELALGDILTMPWYLADQSVRAQRHGTAPGATSMQYRPARPAMSVDGSRELKYEFVQGDDTILGVHPASPGTWYDDATIPLLIAEGQIKADSTLTGILLDAGVDPDELRLSIAEKALDGDTLVLAAQQRLRAILNRLPDDRRVCIVAVAGVYNWRKNPEWTMLALADRDVWISVDGDVASNWNVWNAASQLYGLLGKRKARMSLLAPTVSLDEGSGGKVGADDFLADWGTWADLRAQLTPGLPKQPRRKDADKIGEYRIGDDGTALERCEAIKDEDDQVVGGRWVPSSPPLPIGGRVIAQTVKRRPTPDETRTGRLCADLGRVPVDDERVEIEVSWRGPDGDVVSEVVEGPSDLLVETPDRWHAHSQVTIPAAVKLHPKWPPRGLVAQDWVAAVKANRHDEIQHRTLWTRMGWVPAPGDVPVFTVGNQVIGERVEGTTQSAVSEILHNADLFGVGDDDGATWEDEEYRASVAADLEDTIDAVMAAFGDRSAAAVTLAAGVRAVVPMRSPSVAYLVGPPGSGKSFTAGAISAFWARRPGDWDGSALPGSAKDSVAATEASLSVACFWVIDDLAPSADAHKQRGEQANMDDVIRMVFNGASRGRMTKDGTPRPARIPNAMLVATAENESTVESIRQRALALWFRKGSLAAERDATDALQRLCEQDGAPARVTQGLIKFVRSEAQNTHGGSWEQVTTWTEEWVYKGECKALMTAAMRDAGLAMGNTRAVDTGADLMLSLYFLGLMATDLGLDERYLDLLTDPADGLPAAIARLVSGNWRDHARSTPGRRLLAAISLALRSGRAHVTSAADPRVAPGDGDDQVAHGLGWQVRGDQMAPLGPSIGVSGTIQRTGEQVVLLDYVNAFEVAARLYPDLLPAGTRQAATWQSARDDGLLAEDGAAPGRAVTARHRLSGSPHRFSGVIVDLARLLTPDADIDD